MKNSNNLNSEVKLNLILMPFTYRNTKYKKITELRLFRPNQAKYGGIKIDKNSIEFFKKLYKNNHQKNKTLCVEVKGKLIENVVSYQLNPYTHPYYVLQNAKFLNHSLTKKYTFPKQIKLEEK